MKILAIYRHYWPDTTPYARILHAILQRLVADGHEVEVFTGQPGYNGHRQPRRPRREVVDGVTIYRQSGLPEQKHQVIRRLVNFAWFLTNAVLFAVIRSRPDTIIANSHPPVLMGMTLRAIRRLSGIPYILHCQDVHPESALLANHLRHGWFARWLLRQDDRSCSQAQSVVTLSQDMKRTLLSRPQTRLRSDRVLIVNNFAVDATSTEASSGVVGDEFKSAGRRKNLGNFRIVFAGNIGRYQRLQVLIEAARMLDVYPAIEFLILGAGEQYAEVRSIAGECDTRTIHFLPHQTSERAFRWVKQSDLAVICLAPGVSQVAYPSKTMTYLAAGVPILLIADQDSELSDQIREHGLGYVAASITPSAVAKAILEAYANRGKWDSDARFGLARKAEVLYGHRRTLNIWSDYFRTLEQGCRQSSEEGRSRFAA